VLVSEETSRRYDRLWLREPRQYLHDALLRAHAFLARFPGPDGDAKSPIELVQR